MLSENVEKGTKVLCTNGTFHEDVELPFSVDEINLPKKGDIYTIRNIEESFGLEVGVRLQEIKNRKFHFDFGGYKEPIFSLQRFKLVE